MPWKRFSRAIGKSIYLKYEGSYAICDRKMEFDDGEVEHSASAMEHFTLH